MKRRLAALILWGGALALPGATADSALDAARAGDVPAMLRIAAEYFQGKNRPVNPVLAAYWFGQAAEKGSPEGWYNRGAMLEQGIGLDRDRVAAFRCFERAAPKLPEAKMMVARGLLTGIRAGATGSAAIASDPARGEKLLAELAATGYFPARFEQAARYLARPEAERHDDELKKAVAVFERAAAKNDPRALRLLADCHYHGLGTPRNEKKMFECLTRAVERGDREAAARLGYCWEFGIGTPPRPEKAVALFRRAAEAGMPAAQVKYGEYLLAGEYVPRDVSAAIRWFERAARAGAPRAFYMLARCFDAGWGVVRDEPKAVELLLKSAAGNEPAAMRDLAERYREGRGVPRDAAAAAYWEERSGGK